MIYWHYKWPNWRFDLEYGQRMKSKYAVLGNNIVCKNNFCYQLKKAFLLGEGVLEMIYYYLRKHYLNYLIKNKIISWLFISHKTKVMKWFYYYFSLIFVSNRLRGYAEATLSDRLSKNLLIDMTSQWAQWCHILFKNM